MCYNTHIHILRYSILVERCCLEGDFKASKSTSMKLLVFALVAQTGVYAGRWDYGEAITAYGFLPIFHGGSMRWGGLIVCLTG